MSTDIRTRRLIVTLPDVSGEESDIAIGEIENYIGDTTVFGGRVNHALDEAPLVPSISGVGIHAWPFDIVDDDPTDGPTVTLGTPGSRFGVEGIDADVIRYLTPGEARKLAALLLRAADEAEDGAR